MGDLKIDGPSGDLLIENNALRITSEGMESIGQRLRVRLRFFFREWILDRSKGTQWFELVLRKDVDKFLADQEIRRVVLETPQIRNIEAWDSTLESDTREYKLTATVNTTIGQSLTFGFSDILNNQE